MEDGFYRISQDIKMFDKTMFHKGQVVKIEESDDYMDTLIQKRYPSEPDDESEIETLYEITDAGNAIVKVCIHEDETHTLKLKSTSHPVILSETIPVISSDYFVKDDSITSLESECEAECSELKEKELVTKRDIRAFEYGYNSRIGKYLFYLATPKAMLITLGIMMSALVSGEIVDMFSLSPHFQIWDYICGILAVGAVFVGISIFGICFDEVSLNRGCYVKLRDKLDQITERYEKKFFALNRR